MALYKAYIFQVWLASLVRYQLAFLSNCLVNFLINSRYFYFFFLEVFKFQWAFKFLQFADRWFSDWYSSDRTVRFIYIRLFWMANGIPDNWILRDCMGIDDALLYHVFGSKSYHQFVSAKSIMYNKCCGRWTVTASAMVAVIPKVIILGHGFCSCMPK